MEAVLCMLDALKGMQHVLMVVEIVLCMLELLKGTRHVLMVVVVLCMDGPAQRHVTCSRSSHLKKERVGAARVWLYGAR